MCLITTFLVTCCSCPSSCSYFFMLIVPFVFMPILLFTLLLLVNGSVCAHAHPLVHASPIWLWDFSGYVQCSLFSGLISFPLGCQFPISFPAIFWLLSYTITHIHTYIHTYIYIYIPRSTVVLLKYGLARFKMTSCA